MKVRTFWSVADDVLNNFINNKVIIKTEMLLSSNGNILTRVWYKEANESL